MAEFYGYNPPFIGGSQNIMSRQEDIRLIKNDLLQLLLTIPGERVMREDFGVNLRNIVFEQLDDQTLLLLKSDISVAIDTYEPRVSLDDLTIERDDDNNRINVFVVCRLRSDPSQFVNVELFINDR